MDEAAAMVDEDDTNQWVSVTDRLPDDGWPTLLWGTRLNADDYPVNGCLCSCRGHYSRLVTRGCPQGTACPGHCVVDAFYDDAFDDEEKVKELLGVVTHWLDWSPPVERQF